MLNKVGTDNLYDDESQAIAIISSIHRNNHKGFVFHTSGKQTGLADTGVSDFLIITGAQDAHLARLNFNVGRGDVDILLYEDSTTSADGTGIDELCTNREEANTPVTTIFTGPTITGVGTLLHTQWAPPTSTGTGLSASGASGITSDEEWVLKPNSKHLVRLTNNSGVTIDLRYEFLWYEPNFA